MACASNPPGRLSATPRGTAGSASRAWVAAGLVIWLFAGAMTARVDGRNCDQMIPPIASGYGANGPEQVNRRSVENPKCLRRPVEVFLPGGAPGKRPVIFFSHGYGPGRWQSYKPLIDHVVSRGCILVFSSYPAIFATMGGRYASLWAGFEAAADKFGDRMDLTRVAFVGHSFGGGATPAMAWRGIVKKGWGSRGAFVMELAPWYVLEMTTRQLRELPARVVQCVEVYDRDDTNDHRMAIDLYESSRATHRYFFLVRTLTVDGCTFAATHSTPGRNRSLRLKQYAVFRPFDALADAAFNGSKTAFAALAAMGEPAAGGAYQPLRLESRPSPSHAQSYYRFPWTDHENPRAKR